MEELKYKIEFLTYWHCGSGLSGGAEADSELIKDKDGLPYIPGKTLKGLFRHALMELDEMIIIDQTNESLAGLITDIFGKEIIEKGQVIGTTPGKAFFSNAILLEQESKEIISNGLGNYLFTNMASTKIDKLGIAENGSLRVIEVCMPVTLEAKVTGLESEKQKQTIEKAFKYVREIGINRNRGLGKCKISKI